MSASSECYLATGIKEEKIGKTDEIILAGTTISNVFWSFIVFHLNFLLQSIIPHQIDFVVEEEVLLGGE